MPEKPVATTLPATVQKIIPSHDPALPEKAEIAVEGADELYKEIRIENTLTDAQGNEVKLKPGAQVEVTVEADPDAVVPKSDSSKTATSGKSSSAHQEKAKGTAK
jgi:hypothetical protein